MGWRAWDAYETEARERWRALPRRERYNRQGLLIFALIVGFFVFLLWRSASAQIATGPAPEGEATMVAQKVILDNFEKKDCPLVVRASRFGDGSILAECSNRERFRVFSVKTVGNVAMRCSAMVKLGLSGC